MSIKTTKGKYWETLREPLDYEEIYSSGYDELRVRNPRITGASGNHGDRSEDEGPCGFSSLSKKQRKKYYKFVIEQLNEVMKR